MRILKITQNIIFKEDSILGKFIKGEKVTFTGYFKIGSEIPIGYMKQEPVNDGKSLTLYVKGHRRTRVGEELLLLQTTKTDTNIKCPITMCSYFPYIYKGKGEGYVDETDEIQYGVKCKEGKYFFIHGEYIAKTNIKIEEIPMNIQNGEVNKEYIKAKKKINQMLNRLYVAKKQEKLQLGNLFNLIKPHWGGAHCKLIDIYPNRKF